MPAPDRCPCLRPEPLAWTTMSCPKASCPLRLIRHTWRRLVRDPLAKNPGLIRRPGSIKQPRIADARDAQRRPGILPCTRPRVYHRSCLPVAKHLDVPVADSSPPDDLSPVNNDNPHGYRHAERGGHVPQHGCPRQTYRDRLPRLPLHGWASPGRGGKAYAPLSPPNVR